DDERAPPPIVDREHADVALSSAGRQYDNAAAARLFPCGERLGLKRPRFAPHTQAVLELEVAPRSVLDLHPRRSREQHELGIGERWRPKASTALIPANGSRQLGLGALGHAPELERSRYEVERRRHGRSLNADRFRRRTSYSNTASAADRLCRCEPSADSALQH